MSETIFRGGTILTIDPNHRVLAGDVASVDGVLVHVGGVRRHLGLAERPDRLADRLVLLGQGEQRGLATHGSHRRSGPSGQRTTRTRTVLDEVSVTLSPR